MLSWLEMLDAGYIYIYIKLHLRDSDEYFNSF